MNLSLILVNGYVVTNLGKLPKLVYEDGALNTAVDILYVDLTTSYDYSNYLDDCIDENTVTIIKLKQPTVSGLLPDFIKNNYDNFYTDSIRFGDWETEHKYNSEYYLVFY